MRDILLFALFISLSIVAAWLFAPLGFQEQGFGLFPSLPAGLTKALGALGLSATAAAWVSSWLGWSVAALVLRNQEGGRRAVLHPASLLLAAGGLGWAGSAITLLMRSILRLSEEARPDQVPQLALSMLLASICIPQFEWILPAVASPLFLAAPRSMVRRAMGAFYLSILTPTLALLAFGWLNGAEITAPEPAAPGPQEAALLWLAAPGLVIALSWPLVGRLSLITAVMVTGILTSPVMGTTTALFIGGQALAVLLAAKAKAWVEVTAAIGVVLALWIAKGHISVLL